jgi:hypothetical protein
MIEFGRSGHGDMIEKLAFIIALARERHFGHAAETCGAADTLGRH